MELKKNWPLFIGIIAMILLVWGTFAQGGSLLQKTLFLIGAPVLGITAYFNKQKMFTVIQLVVTIGAILGFFPETNYLIRYLLMLGAAVVSLGYLRKTGYFKTDKYGLIGTIGLFCFAYAFATDPTTHLILFNSLIVIGGILTAVYSTISFFIQKVKIAVIWIILNLLLIINPIIILISAGII